MSSRIIIRSVLLAESLLLIPLVAMQFTDEVNWNLPDFIVVGILLAGLGFSCYMVVNGVKQNLHQTLLGTLLVAAVLLVWAEIAVGIFGTPLAGS